ncbi:MAG TPA: hypothetical protein PLJ65_05625 [Casimicrobium sp.]|nr:hypothetical protein [Casimicrobium sp.]
MTTTQTLREDEMNIVSQLIDFLRHIGLTVVEHSLSEATFLPGLAIEHGTLVVDRVALLYPGDVLHEAGHLAVIPAAERAFLHENVGADGGPELGAIAWSYAAAMHLGLAPSVLFHEAGYKGDAANLIENFAAGRYIGLPILVWRGLTDAPHSGTVTVTTYPGMKRWLAV